MRVAAEQSSSAGLLVGDQLQLRDGGVDVVFGCETKETGEIYNQEADGILGLGNSEVSMVNQVCCSHLPCIQYLLQHAHRSIAEREANTLQNMGLIGGSRWLLQGSH